MSGELANALELFKALESRHSSDDKFVELLGEISAGLADILARLEKPEAKKDEQAEAEAIGKSLAAALIVGLKSMQPPTIQMPARLVPESQQWNSITAEPVRDGAGNLTHWVLTRL